MIGYGSQTGGGSLTGGGFLETGAGRAGTDSAMEVACMQLSRRGGLLGGHVPAKAAFFVLWRGSRQKCCSTAACHYCNAGTAKLHSESNSSVHAAFLSDGF